ncbi:MAG: hypothetical protein NZ959_01210 [Armatimonadetes bacterium]|nr:hypothetical protein [Armatimonadota bacterium]MDW8121868.1 DUF6785 family protein [Armatimonadota bacterium]
MSTGAEESPIATLQTTPVTAPVRILRPLLLGLTGTILLAWLVPVFDLLVQGTWIASCHLPIGVLNLFVIILLVLSLIKAVSKRVLLTRKELLIAYCMLTAGSGLPSFGFTEYLFPTLAGTLYYARPENRWAERTYRFIPQWFVPWDVREMAAQRGGVSLEPAWWDSLYQHIPSSLRPGGPEVIRHLYEGLPEGARLPIGPWVVPLIAWSFLALPFFLALFFLSTLIRRQWLEHDRLVFPLADPPLEMTQSADSPKEIWSPFFRHRLVWVGALIPFLIHSINGLHFYFPWVPEIRLSFPLNESLTSYLFSNIGPFIAIIHFSVIGVTFLLPSDLAFSLWFFYFFFMGQSILLTWMGRQIPGFPGYATPAHAGLQMLGAFFAIFVYLIRVGRLHYRQVLREGLKGSSYCDPKEPVPYSVAFRGLILCLLLTTLWCAIAGASFFWALISWLILMVIATALTRFVSEGGLLFVQAFRPSDLLFALLGTRPFTQRHMTVMAFVEKVFMFDLRTFLMPFLMDSYRIASVAELPVRPLFRSIGISIVSSLISSSWSFLSLVYRKGANTMMQGAGAWFLNISPQQVLQFTVSYFDEPRQPTPLGRGFFLLGIIATLFFYRARQNFPWFPFHPVGYAMGPSWPMIQLWFSILIGWLIKSLLIHYGGLRSFRTLRPFFLGLLLGEYLTAGLWLLLDLSYQKVGHRMFLF